MKTVTNRDSKVLPVLFALLLVVPAFGSYGQQPTAGDGRGFSADRIAILPFVNTTTTEQWDNLAVAMSETIELTLRLSGQFDVATVDTTAPIDPYAPDGPIRLRELSEEYRLDAMIIGRISERENGRVELQAAAYSADTGEIVGEETRVAFGSFDILDAADELVIIASSAFLGYQIDYGAVVLEPSRNDVAYRVYIDGILIGENVRSVPQILTGRRTIEIALQTGRGEQYVYAADRLIRPGEAIEVFFNLPAVTSTEQREIRASHDVARELLGQPEEYLVAFDALRESRQLLRESVSEALDPLREEQKRLETLWQLDEELYRLDPTAYGPDGSYTPGNPLEMMSGTRDLVDEAEEYASDSMFRDRIIRNGAAQYHLVHLAWAAALGDGDWDRAELIRTDMDVIAEHYSLPASVTATDDVAAWNEAVVDAEGYSRRARRPWPYIGLAAGLGGIGFGGYYIATDQVGRYEREGDDYYDDYEIATTGVEAESLREKAEDEYDKAQDAEFVQWTSIAAGAVVAILSTWRIIANRRADETFLRDWAFDRFGREVTTSEAVFDGSLRTLDPSDDDGTVRVLVLGPSGDVVDVAGNPRLFPAIVEIPHGSPLPVGRAPIVEADRDRIYTDPFSVVVLQ